MPVRHLVPYVDALPRLEARVALLQAQATSVGIGLAPAGRAKILLGWRAAMRTVEKAATRLRRDPGMLAHVARSSGIGFRTVKRKAK